MEVIEVPEYVDFLMTVNFKKVNYANLILENFTGNLAIRDKILGLNDVSFNTLDGTIGMDGIYHTKNPKKPKFVLTLTSNRLNIKKTYKAFGSVKKMAPIAEKCNGEVSTDFRVQGFLDPNMDPDLNSLSGYGKLSTYGVTIDNFKPLVKAAEVLKMDQLKKAKVSDVNLSFNFENGRVTLNPFDVEVEGIKSTIAGNHGFDQTIDYTMQMKIPTKMLGGDANALMNDLIANANKSGANLNTVDEIPVTLKITGTVDDPKIKTDLKKSASSVMDDLKDQAKEEFDRQKKELEEKARQEVDKFKKEAEEKAKQEVEKLKKQAQEEADRIKEQAKKDLLKGAEDKLKDLFGKPK
jgi:vacuolar-type H+-ATPase subunit H